MPGGISLDSTLRPPSMDSRVLWSPRWGCGRSGRRAGGPAAGTRRVPPGAAEPVLPEHLLAEEVLDRVGVEGERLLDGLDGLVEVAGGGVELASWLRVSTATLRTCS